MRRTNCPARWAAVAASGSRSGGARAATSPCRYRARIPSQSAARSRSGSSKSARVSSLANATRLPVAEEDREARTHGDDMHQNAVWRRTGQPSPQSLGPVHLCRVEPQRLTGAAQGLIHPLPVQPLDDLPEHR